MKVIFTGIHNKPDKPPLCSTTRTGKLVDAIIARVHEECPKLTCVKSNFFDANELPEVIDRTILYANESNWRKRTGYKHKHTLVIGFGKVVQHCLDLTGIKHLKFVHPASVRSNEKRKRYVHHVAQAITFIIKAKTKPHVKTK